MKTDATAIAQADTLSPAAQQPAVLSATQLSTATEKVADTALLSHFIDNVNNGLTTHEALAQAQLTVNTIATAEHAVTIATPQQSVQMQQDNALATGENINALLPEDSTQANTFIAALNAALAEDTEPELAFASAQSTLQHTEALHVTLQTPLAEKAQLLTSLATDSAANNQLIPNTSDTSDSSNSDADIFSYHLLDELSHGQSIDTAFTDAQHVKQVLAQAQNTSVIPISDADAFISNLSNPANIDTQIDHLAFTSSQSEALQSAFTNDQPPYEAIASANSASTLITSVETSLTVPSDSLLTALASGEHVTETIAAIVPDAASIVASQAQASQQEVEASLNVAFDKAVTLTDAVKEAQATSNATDKVLLEIQTAVADSPDKALIQALASGENISTALSSVINLTEQKTNGDNAVNTQVFAETLSNALAQGSNINTAILNAQTEARQQTRAEHAVQLPQQDKNTGLLLALATGNALNEQALKTEVLNALSEQIQQQPGEMSLEQALTLAQQHINVVMATLTDINVPQATSTILGLLSGNERITELIQSLSINPELLTLLESIPQTTTFEAMQELITQVLASGLSVNAPLERAALALNEAKASSIDTLLSSPEHLTSPTAKLATLINPTAAIEHSPSLLNILSLLNTLHQLFENIQIKDAVSLLLTKQENALQDLAELYTLLETKINAMEALLKLNVIAEQQFNLLQQAINLNRNVTQSLLFLNAIPLRAEEAGGEANASPGINPSGNFFIDLGISPTSIKFVIPDQLVQPFIVLTGTYGQLTLYLNGAYVYELANTNPSIEALTPTTYLIDTFKSKLINPFGDTTVIKLSIIIKGANDAPLAVNDTDVATEAGGVSNQTVGTNATGNVLSNDSDSDGNDTKTVTAGVFAGQFGSLTLNADGSYVYVIDNTKATVNALKTSTDTLSDAFSYTVTDAAGLTSSATLTLTLQGANDAPSLTAVNSVNYTALAIPTVLAPDLSLTDSDSSLLSSALIFVASGWDLQDQLSFTSPTAAISGLYEPDTGLLTLSGDASLNDYQQALRSVSFSSSSTNPMSTLASRTVLWQITDSDQTLALSSELSSSSITIITANNAPLVITPTAITQQDTATYDRYSIITAALLATDADNNLLNYGLVNGILDGITLSLTSAYGTLSIDSETGAYTYTPNGLTLNALGNEDSFTDNYLFTVSDGTTSTTANLAINITGANDTPTGTVLITDDYGYPLTTINSGTKLNNLSTSISDADGLGVFSYQWETSTDNSTWTAVEGGTLSSYTTTTKDENTQLHVKISYLDGNNYTETLTSNSVYIYTAYTPPTNTPPTFTGGANTGLYLASAGAAAVISAAVLTVLDYEQTPDALQYTLSALPTLGELSINGVLLNTYDSFTQADINNGLLNYQSYRNFSTIDNFTFDVSDGAGGVLSQQEFFIFSTLAAPVVIDLTNNGFNFIDITQSTINVDMNADGELDRTAWLAADDGLLAIDLNANQRIDQTHEFVFTQSAPTAPTDLAALQQLYDSNHDFLLTPDDAQWSAFGIWQDSNSNGLSDTNEFNSLTSWGVTEINLLSDEQQNTPAAGVFIEGMSNVIFADHHSSAAADANFAYQPSSQLTRLTIAQNTELSLKDQFTGETKPATPSSLETLSITSESTATLDNEFMPQDATDSQAYFDDFAVPTHLS